MRLLHYSKRGPVIFDRDFRYQGHGFAKTPGFWVSVEGPHDWRSWCESEQWELEALECEHEVTLAPNANILKITTPKQFDDFCSVYVMGSCDGSWDKTPDWGSLRKIYDGLIIAPYRWDKRLNRDCLWYYTWDCASGVIWNLSAIESVTHIGKKEAA